MEENGKLGSLEPLQNNGTPPRPPLRKQFLPKKSQQKHLHSNGSASTSYKDAQDGLRNLTVKSAVNDVVENGAFIDESGENVYGEIGRDNVHQSSGSYLLSNVSYNGTVNDNSHNESPQISSSTSLQSYQLRPKRRRHVYHEIVLPSERDKNTEEKPDIPPRKAPPLPFKPHYLRAEFSGDFPPPLPPRVLNKDALIQRKQLTEEYFENIRKSVDMDLLDDFLDAGPSGLPCATESLSPRVQFGNDSGAGTSSVQSPNTTDDENQYWTIENDPDNSEQRHSIPLLESSSNHLPPTTLSCESGNETGLSKEKSFPGLHTGPRVQFIQSLKCLKQCGWYWGNMSWEDAEAMLDYKPNVEGVFLVRDSQDPLHLFTLTVRSAENTIHHVRIEHTDGKFQLYEPSGSVSQGAANCVRHPNIVTFIKLVMKHSQSGTFIYFVKTRNMGEPPVQIRLLTPISRFACVKSLKYYTRFVIKDLVPTEFIDSLSIPSKLKDYLRESQYFDPKEDFYCALAS